MIKSFLIILSFSILLHSSQQLILVVADDVNSSQAKLQCYEDGKKFFDTITVNIGKNGLGMGLGEKEFLHTTQYPQKIEGDKKAPIGVFKLTNIFGYAKSSHVKLPYLYASENLICVDDSHSNFYNHIIQANGDEKSFEFMKRKDAQYEFGVVVAHNERGLANRGSCIFLHVQKAKKSGTAGCTSMQLKDLKKIINWLDKEKKPLLIQIPQGLSEEVLELYPELKSSELLN